MTTLPPGFTVDMDQVRLIERLEFPADGETAGPWRYTLVRIEGPGSRMSDVTAWVHDNGTTVTVPVDGELVVTALRRAVPGSLDGVK